MQTNHVPIRRALLSVSDKTGLVEFARALAARGVAIISTGGTAKALKDAGVPVTPVEQVTGFPEGLDGRVKTLHPAVHAGLLSLRDNPEHQAFMRRHGFEPIDLVCINLYPFQQTIARPGVSREEAIENIDIGGPAMLRAAAKNHAFVTVVSSPEHYARVLAEMDEHGGATTHRLRAELAAATYGHTSRYDGAISRYLAGDHAAPANAARFPERLNLSFAKAEELRYGENPHQAAALYRDPEARGQTLVGARQLHGKQLSYNNINDGVAALEACGMLAATAAAQRAALELPGGAGRAPVAAVVVKHTIPCGGAVAPDAATAVRGAIAGDPIAAYGGILALGTRLDRSTAEVVCDPKHFFEVVLAPDYDDDALELLRNRWANVRLLAVGDAPPAVAEPSLEFRSVPGGLLVQDRDAHMSDPSGWQHQAGPRPADQHLAAAAVLDTLCRWVTSNAVVVGGFDGPCVRLFGVGSGQVDRVSACRLAVAKAADRARGAIAVGDAFFPFSDGPRILVDAGVALIVHPGGSKRDQDTFDLCRDRGVACLTTGVRRFRH